MHFSILHWSAFAPGFESKSDWEQWAKSNSPSLITGSASPDMKFLPLLMRRRLGLLSKMAIWCIYQLDCEHHAELPMVFSSRHGESSATNEILSILSTKAEISPTDFSLSVHNACPGLYSIHAKNQCAYTAIAAGTQTFSMGLLEAISLSESLALPVLMVYAENELNPKFQVYLKQKIPPHAIALCINACTTGDYQFKLNSYFQEDCPEQIDSLSFMKWFTNKSTSKLHLNHLSLSFQS